MLSASARAAAASRGRDDLEFGRLALGFRAHGRGLALARRAQLRGLRGDGAADGGSLADGILCEGLLVCLRLGDEFGRLDLRILEGGRRAGAGIGEHPLGLLRRRLLDLVDLCGHAAAQLLGVDVGLGDQARGLLFGDAKRVLELGAEPRERRASDLFDLGVELLDADLEPLDLLGRVGNSACST